MFSRLSQVARHLSRPLPNFAHASAANFRPSITSSVMAGATTTEQKGLIHTAACLIIGDEVLGGKVRQDLFDLSLSVIMWELIWSNRQLIQIP
jgi:hypothetical protein